MRKTDFLFYKYGGANYMYIVCTAHLPLSKDSLRKMLVACYVRSVIGIPTTSVSWESLSLNLTVTEEKMGG